MKSSWVRRAMQGCAVGGALAGMVFFVAPADAQTVRSSLDLANLGVTIDCPSATYFVVSGSLDGTTVELPNGYANIFTFSNVEVRDSNGNSYAGQGGVVINATPGLPGIAVTSLQILADGGRVATVKLTVNFGSENGLGVNPSGECESNVA